VSVSKASIALLSALLVSPASAGSMIGISVGDPLSTVPAKLRQFGPVTDLGGSSGAGYMTSDYFVVGCRGRVWSVSRALSPTFRTFAASAKKTELELGAKPTAEVFSDDGTQELSTVTLLWDLGDGSAWSVLFASSPSGTSVSESVRQKTYCSGSRN
jgi:hypothetical protein